MQVHVDLILLDDGNIVVIYEGHAEMLHGDECKKLTRLVNKWHPAAAAPQSPSKTAKKPHTRAAYVSNGPNGEDKRASFVMGIIKAMTGDITTRTVYENYKLVHPEVSTSVISNLLLQLVQRNYLTRVPSLGGTGRPFRYALTEKQGDLPL